MEVGGMAFGSFDVVVFIILGFSGILSFARGFSRELISILSLLIGLAAALFIFGRYNLDVQNFIKPGWLADIVLFISVFLLVYLLITFVMKGWAKTLRGRKPGFIDRILGFAFGLFRGAIIGTFLMIFLTSLTTDDVTPEYITESKTYPVLKQISDTVEKIPFFKGREIAEDIINKGEESDILPDIPKEDQ